MSDTFGRLIVLEGLDGAGTTTQSHRLVEWLTARGRNAHFTREPSDGPIGKLIREMLTGGHAISDTESIDQNTFALLFAADRMDHLQREVEPFRKSGGIVVSDRWYHSSLAYQGTGSERTWIRQLNQRARRPDLTVFLRVRAEVAAERRVAAGRAQELFEEITMQQRVAAGYDAVMAQLSEEGEHIAIVDGEMAIDDVTKAIFAAVTPYLV